jgi:hypothetical protein
VARGKQRDQLRLSARQMCHHRRIRIRRLQHRVADLDGDGGEESDEELNAVGCRPALREMLFVMGRDSEEIDAASQSAPSDEHGEGDEPNEQGAFRKSSSVGGPHTSS